MSVLLASNITCHINSCEKKKNCANYCIPKLIVSNFTPRSLWASHFLLIHYPSSSECSIQGFFF